MLILFIVVFGMAVALYAQTVGLPRRAAIRSDSSPLKIITSAKAPNPR